MINETILSIEFTCTKKDNCRECLLEVYFDSHSICTSTKLTKRFEILALVSQIDESTLIIVLRIAKL